jgi:uncharacterized membrane-anchored protein
MRKASILAALAAAALLSTPARADDDAATGGGEPEPRYTPTSGPAKVSLGKVAEIDLPEGILFFDAKDTRGLLEDMGNITDGSELGLVSPQAEGEDWFIVFEYDDIGYIKDAAKETIDPDGLLKSIQEGTERSNEERKKRGHTPMHVTGWAEAPHYDPQTQNLTWATLYETDDGNKGLNYNVRLLGRSGVMRVTLVDAPDRLAASKPAADRIIGAFGFKQGKRYSEWRSGDKVAQYGLTALVAGGAGAAAVKFGLFAFLGKLLAKMGKAVILVFAAIAGVIAKAWKSIAGAFTRRKAAAVAGTSPAPGAEGTPGPGPGPGQGSGFLE